MKKYLALVMAVLMALTCVALVACGEEEPCTHNYENGTCTLCGEADPNYVPEQGGGGANIYTDEEFHGTALPAGKVYLTTIGQADFAFAETLLTHPTNGAGYTEATIDYNLTAAEVEDGAIVIAVVGYTAKGLATDITVTGEQDRATAFATKAEEGKISLVVLHLGGAGRRGDTSDPMIETMVSVADYTLIYHDVDDNDNGADYDGAISGWVTTELYRYADEMEIVPALKVLLGL